MANGTICAHLEPSIRSRYKDDKFDDPQVLWEAIQTDFEKVIELECRFEMAKLTDCKLEQYPSISKWITALEKNINDLAICNITIDDAWRKIYILSNLPNNKEWRNFVRTLELTKKADMVAIITSHLPSFEATLRRAKGLSPDAKLFLKKMGRGGTSKGNGSKSESRGQKSQSIVCHGC